MNALNWAALELEFLALIEETIHQQLREYQFVSRLASAVEYVLFPGGKRLRPLLALFLCRDLGGDPTAMLPAAAAIELVHCASLVHDDLPALDNDDMRRGRAACHREFGEATAILTGDALTMLSIEVLTGMPLISDDKVKLVTKLAAAFRQLCDGQQQDLLAEERSYNLEQIHRQKTGALFSSATGFAAVVAGLGLTEQRKLECLGEETGVYFQLVDDFVDSFGSDQIRGRVGSSDHRNNRELLWRSSDKGAALGMLKGRAAGIEDQLLCVEADLGGIRLDGTRYILAEISSRWR